jgi:hypothetical protein
LDGIPLATTKIESATVAGLWSPARTKLLGFAGEVDVGFEFEVWGGVVVLEPEEDRERCELTANACNERKPHELKIERVMEEAKRKRSCFAPAVGV